MSGAAAVHDVIVVGAGAAGMLCAFTAGQRGRRVLLLEAAAQPGEKIRISGGGRCNFTNLHSTPANFLSANPHFCISALRGYTPHDFLALVERHGIGWHEKTAGQLFCDDTSQRIIDLLLTECRAAGVELRVGSRIDNIERLADGAFAVTTAGTTCRATSLVIATGGPSIPKIGASDFAYRVARRFGLRVVEPRPGLVPFTVDGPLAQALAELRGIALTVDARCAGVGFRDGLLFTHRGLSGPAVLQVSSYWRSPEPVVIDLAPGTDLARRLLDAKRARPRLQAPTVLAEHLPRRLGQFLVAGHALAERRLAECTDAALAACGRACNAWQLVPAGTEGLRKAEVTVGGVDTTDLESRTMAARNVPGLHFIGEAVDVTGHLGGHNFQWAWASGHAAGNAV